MSAIPTKQLEFWLAGWTKSHNGGTKVTFTINDEDLPYFENATIRKGKHAGQRYAAVLVQLQDDDTPDPDSVKPLAPGACPPDRVPNPGIAKAHELAEASAAGAETTSKAQIEASTERTHRNKFPAGYCGLSVRWCDDVHFREWLESTFPDKWHRSQAFVRLANKGADIERAAWVVKDVCSVNSRTELDTHEGPHALFRDLIFTPYREQRQADGIDG